MKTHNPTKMDLSLFMFTNKQSTINPYPQPLHHNFMAVAFTTGSIAQAGNSAQSYPITAGKMVKVFKIKNTRQNTVTIAPTFSRSIVVNELEE